MEILRPFAIADTLCDPDTFQTCLDSSIDPLLSPSLSLLKPVDHFGTSGSYDYFTDLPVSLPSGHPSLLIPRACPHSRIIIIDCPPCFSPTIIRRWTLVEFNCLRIFPPSLAQICRLTSSAFRLHSPPFFSVSFLSLASGPFL